MRPGTKLQHEIVKLDKTLPRINSGNSKRHKKKIDWMFQHALDHEAVRMKSGKITCLDCAGTWQSSFNDGWKDVVTGETCPHCKQVIIIKQTQKKKFSEWSYVSILSTVKGFQVIRICKVTAHYFSGKLPDKRVLEVGRIWIREDGKFELVGQQCGGMGYYMADNWHGEWCLRGRYAIDRYNIVPYKIYPVKKVMDIIKRNGFDGNFYKMKPFKFINLLMSESHFETLLKAKQKYLLNHCSSSSGENQIKRYWDSIKICLRNNYMVKDASSYFDYLDFLASDNKDLRNKKFVCPEDFKKVHQYYVKREIKRRAIENERLRIIREEEERLKEKNKIKNYIEHIKPFKHIKFIIPELDNLTIKPLSTIRQVKQAGENLVHCIYIKDYHRKKNSLLLGAYLGKKIVETTEVSLENYTVKQSRGYDNENTKYTSIIVKTINSKMNIIKNASLKRRIINKQSA